MGVTKIDSPELECRKIEDLLRATTLERRFSFLERSKT